MKTITRIRLLINKVRASVGMSVPEVCCVCGESTSLACHKCAGIVPVCINCKCPKCGG